MNDTELLGQLHRPGQVREEEVSEELFTSY
jgi:hypothetical protein